MKRIRTMPVAAPRAALASGFLALALAALAAVFAPAPAGAAEKVPSSQNRPSVDVWINKEEGGVFTSGERMQVFFRSSQDAYVLIYNIDTEGYIHLIYPFRPDDPMLVRGGETYRVPSRHDPYDLVAEGPVGMEYVVAIASPLPFQNLPWYLAPGSVQDSRDRTDAAAEGERDDLDQGVIVGDPYVGMENLHRRIVPPERDDQVATDNTFFYIERRVEYPRYVCADCHHRTYWFDPYVDYCSVVEIRIDATWARYAPVYYGYGPARPRYYYQMRPSAPSRYQGWKERWSSLDGNSTLRQRFVLEREAGAQRVRSGTARRQAPPEFKDLRRYRPGRFWKGRDQVIPLRETREKDAQSQARDRRAQPQTQPPVAREQDRRAEQNRRNELDRRAEQNRRNEQDRQRQAEERRKPPVEKKSEEQKPPEARERKEPPKSEPRGRVEERGRSEEKGRSEFRSEPQKQRPPSSQEQERESRGRGR
ncbi:MAG TPA: DUF4384 domain-containing protein [Candidatus Eisenbacteria bacterium]|nr:DUF4384 domain-containing protein [Candidatus Eisenbacteria bacterium]